MKLLFACISLTLCVNESHFIDMETTCVERIITKFPNSVIYTIDTNLKLNYPVIYQTTIRQYLTLFQFRYPDLYVIDLEALDIDQMLQFLEQFDIFNSRAKYIILSKNAKPGVILQKLLKYFIYNAVVLTPNGTTVTFNPFINENVSPDDIQPIVLGSCLELEPSELFNTYLPKVWRNTTIPAVFFNMYPFLYADQNNEIQGMAFRNFKLIQDVLKFRINVTRTKVGAFGAVRINRTYTNVLDSPTTPNAQQLHVADKPASAGV
nr:PREDICTED: uncharacterized protein LOC107398571 [Tribolium castaneum]|eukprot:XP_015838496.1 PREDICTED: uncharacterized protein LOC107398571 [Tribolium castaneum]